MHSASGGCVEVDYAYQSALPGCGGREITVQWDHAHVRLLDPAPGQFLREHRRQITRGRYAIHFGTSAARTTPTTITLLGHAARAGTHVGTLDAGGGWPRIGRSQGHGAAYVDAACAAALDLAVADYRFVRR